MEMENKKRSFSDVDDCIYCIDKLATDPNIKSEIVNIGPGPENEITINRLFEIISNEVQFNQEPRYEKERPNEVKIAICSSEHAQKLLNYKSNEDIKKLYQKWFHILRKGY